MLVTLLSCVIVPARSVFAIVEHYKVRRRTTRLLRHAFEFAELPFDRNADPFSAVIRCTSDDNADSGTMTHDYKRNGTTTLFAALNMLDGTVIGECMPRHRHREFLRFLKTIEQRTLPNLDLHLIVDNYATHKTPAVKRWLKRHARFHLHFTPTSGSWLNMVERFFAEITRKRIRRGVFKSVDELKQAIMDYLDNHNGHPKPYIWTKTATEIFSKVARAKQVLESQH